MYKINEFASLDTHQRALLLSYLCQVLYQYPILNNKWINRLGINDYTFGFVGSVRYWVVNTDTHQFLVINGTDTNNGLWESIKDLSISANLFPKKGMNGIWYHRGYYNASKDLVNDVTQKELVKEDKELVICGHSMGGAIAKILSGVFKLSNMKVYTFGAPQVSMGQYRNHTESHHHYVNKGDFIPSYPSSIYWEDVPIHFIDSDITYSYPKRLGIFIPAYRRIRDMLGDDEDSKIFHPHAITNYIRHLLKNQS